MLTLVSDHFSTGSTHAHSRLACSSLRSRVFRFLPPPAGRTTPATRSRLGPSCWTKATASPTKAKPAEARDPLQERLREASCPGSGKIPFKHEVKRDVTKREAMKAMLLKEFDEDMTPAEFRANEMAMKAFGLVPRSLDLKPLLVQVYSEEIAAFYDPKTKTMHLIEEPESKAKAQPSFLERLLGKKAGLRQGREQDGHRSRADPRSGRPALRSRCPAQGMPRHDDDRSLAVSALIEGEATLAMMGAQMDDWDGSKITKMPADDLDRGLSFISPVPVDDGGGQEPAIRRRRSSPSP